MVKADIPVTFVFVRSKENCRNDLKCISINSMNSLFQYISWLCRLLLTTWKTQGKRILPCHYSNIPEEKTQCTD